MSTTPVHPGHITFVDAGREHVESAEAVPESIRFAHDRAGQLVPVVRVVSIAIGPHRAVREYGADGALLRSTVATT